MGHDFVNEKLSHGTIEGQIVKVLKIAKKYNRNVSGFEKSSTGILEL